MTRISLTPEQIGPIFNSEPWPELSAGDASEEQPTLDLFIKDHYSAVLYTSPEGQRRVFAYNNPAEAREEFYRLEDYYGLKYDPDADLDNFPDFPESYNEDGE